LRSGGGGLSDGADGLEAGMKNMPGEKDRGEERGQVMEPLSVAFRYPVLQPGLT
jgi:hypothetical protein